MCFAGSTLACICKSAKSILEKIKNTFGANSDWLRRLLIASQLYEANVRTPIVRTMLKSFQIEGALLVCHQLLFIMEEYSQRAFKNPIARGSSRMNVPMDISRRDLVERAIIAPNYSSGVAFDKDGNVIEKWSGGEYKAHFANFVKAIRRLNFRRTNRRASFSRESIARASSCQKWVDGKKQSSIDRHDEGQIREVAIENLGIKYRIEVIGV